MFNEQFVLRCIRQLPEDREGVAIDLGANHGKYTTLLARKFKKVYAFEPHEFNVVFLKRSISHTNNVEIVQKAASNENGKIKFYVNHFNPGGHTANPNVAGTGLWGHDLETFIEVEAVTLDSFFKDLNERVVAIKCDVEGGEEFLFDGAKELLTNNKLRLILEVHQRVNAEKLFNLFDHLGYKALNDQMQEVYSFENDAHYLISNV